MSQDWLRELYLRWIRRSARRPARPGISVELLESRLTPALTVQVYEDWNNNGQSDFGDPGVPGAAILVDLNGNGLADVGEPRGLTNGAGQFTVNAPTPGTYPVLLTSPNGFSPAQGSQTVTVAAGATVDVNFGLIHLNSVYGTAYADANRNGAREPTEGGVGGIGVYLDLNGNGKYDAPVSGSASSTGPVPIFDLQTSVSTVDVTGLSGKIGRVTLKLNIAHTFDFDLEAALIAPDGTVVTLFSGVGGAGQNFTDTVLDDAAGVLIDNGAAPFTGTFRPTSPLSQFNGHAANGTWKLVVSDNFAQDQGQILDWTLNLTTSGDQSVTTGPSGRYRLDALPGTYKVGLIETRGYAPTNPASWDDLIPITLAKNATVTGNDFGLFADAVSPTVTAITRIDKSPIHADQVRYQVRFSEPVIGAKPSAFGVSATGLTGVTVDSVTGSGTVYTVTVASTGGDGDLQLTIPDLTAITDLADNPIAAPVPAAPTYTIDRSPPRSTIDTPAAGVYTPATWVGSIGGTAADDGSGLTGVLVSIRQPGTGKYWDGTAFGSPTELFTPAVGRANWSLPFPTANLGGVEGPYVVRATGVDGAGNRQPTPTELQFGFDIGPPSFTVTPNATPLNANPVRFTLTFTEPVTAPDAARVTVAGGTLSGIAPVGGQVGVFASKYEVVVVPAGDGPVTITVAPGVAADVANNPSGGGGAAVTFDGTPPTVTVGGPADLAVTTAAWAGGLSGTSADNLTGVATVGVAVRRQSTGTYWDGTGFTAASPVYLPTAGALANWTFAFPAANFPADDNYSFTVRGADAAGNVTTASVAVAYDNQSPAPTVATPGAAPVNAATFDGSGRIAGAAADAVSGPAETTVAIRETASNRYWDGSAFASLTPVALTTTGTPAAWSYLGLPADRLHDGAYTVAVRTTDRAGNVGTASRTFNFDNTPSVPVFDFPNGGTGYNPDSWEAAGQLTGHVIDANDTVSTRVAVRRLSDGLYWNGSFFGSAAPVFNNTTGTPSDWRFAFASSFFPDEGLYEAIATSTDAAGNERTEATRFSFDRTTPSSAINLPGSGTLFNLTSWPGVIPGSASDNLSGVTRVRISLRQVDGGRYWDGAAFTSATEVLFDTEPTGTSTPNGPFGAWSFPFAVAGFKADGNYVVSTYATDGAGNSQSFASTSVIRIDRTPPTGEVLPAGPTTTKAAEIPFDFNFSEPVAGLPAGALSISNAQLVRITQKSPASFSVVLKPLADGAVSVGLADRGTTDLAGNPIGAVPAASVQSVTTPPGVTITPPASPPVAGGQATFRVAFTQEVTGFEAGDLSLLNAKLAGLSQVSGGPAGSVFDVTVSPLGAGPVSVTLNPGTVFNRVGLSNGAAATVSTTAVEQRFAVGVGSVARLYDRNQGISLQVNPFGQDFTGEVRVATADFTGDGVPDLVAGSGPGSAPMIVIIDGATSQTRFQLTPFESTFTGGVYVAVGDITGDGVPDLIVSPDQGGGPRVQVRDGKTFDTVADFFGIDDTNFRGGARAAVGDVNGDGRGDLIVAAGFGGGPRVAVFEGKSVLTGSPVRVVSDFFAYEQSLRNGVYVAAGDLDGDGFADLAIGGGPGGGPRTSVLSGRDLATGVVRKTADFFAGDVNNRGGVRVAVGDLSADPGATLLVGSGAGGGTRVTGYNGRSVVNGAPIQEIDFDLATGTATGVYVG